MLRAFAAVVVLLQVLPARAQTRWSLAPELSLGAGWDDNLFLDPTLAGAGAAPRADVIFDVHPSLVAAMTRHDHALSLTADYLERITLSNGDLRDLYLRLDWASAAWHRLRLLAGGFYEHYEADRFPDNTFDLGGGEAALRVIVAAAWIEARYRFAARGYEDPTRAGQLDLEQRAALFVHGRLHRMLTADAGYSFLHVASNEPTAALDRHRVDVALALRPTARLTLAAGYGLWWQALPNGAMPIVVGGVAEPGGPRTDLAHEVTASLTVRPLSWLSLFARYDLIVSTSDAAPGQYRRNQALAGLALGWEFARARLPPPPPLRPTVAGRQVTFYARARAGAKVAVIGDWNGWTPAPLQPAGDDRFAGTYTLPPGRHAWALQIDGAVKTPPEAAGYVDDGFGGRNAVVDVR